MSLSLWQKLVSFRTEILSYPLLLKKEFFLKIKMIEKSRQIVLSIYSLRRADHSSRGVIQSVIEEPHRGGLDPLGLSGQERERERERKKNYYVPVLYILRVHSATHSWIKYYFTRFMAVCSVYRHVEI
jgi:hypothetical protein